MNKFLATTAIICAAGLTSFSANAQSLNYGMMQEMFGEPVTTSANGSPMRESDVPLNMTIISAEDIARYPAKEIPDILRNYAGVNVRQVSTMDYNVGVRGYNQFGAERLLVLVNGRQVYEDYYGLVNWKSIPVELGEIRQIEIVRGPNTALFGFNAVSGVVNIVTFNPLYDDVDYVEVDAGTDSYRSASGVYTLQDDNWAARISYANQSMDQDENTYNPTESGILNIDEDTQNVNLDVALQLDSSTQMRFEVSQSDISGNAMTAYGDGAQIKDEFGALKMSISSDTDYGIIDGQFYVNNADVGYLTSGGLFAFDNTVVVTQLSDTFKVGTDHTFRIAGEFRNNQTEHSLNGTVFGNHILNIKSLSSLWYWNMTDNMSLSVAGRYDHVRSDLDDILGFVFAFNPYGESAYNNSYDEFGYNIGYVYKATDVDTVRATISKGVDLPSSFEIAFQLPAALAGFDAYGNPNLDVSDVHDFQLGYERSLVDWNSTFKASAFYQVINEQQGFDNTLFVQNEGDSEIYGLELSLDGVTDSNIRWGLNYNYSKVENDDPQGTDFADMNSDHIVNGRIGYSPTAEWDYDLYGSYVTDFETFRDFNNSTGPYDVDGGVVFDAKVTYKPEAIEGLSVSLNGQGISSMDEQTAYGEDLPTQVFLRLKYEM